MKVEFNYSANATNLSAASRERELTVYMQGSTMLGVEATPLKILFTKPAATLIMELDDWLASRSSGSISYSGLG